MKVLGIDPGTTETAWCIYGSSMAAVVASGKAANGELLDTFRQKFLCGEGAFSVGQFRVEVAAIEMIASYGMAVGAEVFETCTWIGRFEEALSPLPVARVYRREVKSHLCGSQRAKDANVRHALLDRFGGRATAIGTKRAPGPLYGVSGDVWSALAVAITYAETRKREVAA